MEGGAGGEGGGRKMVGRGAGENAEGEVLGGGADRLLSLHGGIIAAPRHVPADKNLFRLPAPPQT